MLWKSTTHRLIGLAACVAILLPNAVNAQTAISTEGPIESQSGGFIFPDGSLQTTASTSSPIANMSSTRLLCSYTIPSTFNCSYSVTSFPAGSSLHVYGIHGVVSHTDDGGGTSGLPGGLCEGSISVGGVTIAKIQVQPGQSQNVSREFSRAIGVSPSMNLDLNSARTGGGSCIGNLYVMYVISL